MNEELKTMHLFAGAGGGILADLILGHRPIVAVEWDKYACEVLRARAADGWFDGMSVWEGDVREFDPSEYKGRVDCIHAGFPCQDISGVGTKAGVGNETRSGLYREVLRIADVLQPQFLFLENVARIVTGSEGGMLRTVTGDLASRGYDAVWACLSAAEVGANHKRDRWWLLAYSNGVGHGGRDSEGCDLSEWAIFQGQQSGSKMGSQTPRCSWWQAEPQMDRVVDGFPDWASQHRGLGNAQVPLQSAAAFEILKKQVDAIIMRGQLIWKKT